MIWWISSPKRAMAEKAAVGALFEASPYLRNLNWNCTQGLAIHAEFEVAYAGEVIELVLTYPSTFPDTPPTVQPRTEQRLSDHQYGAGGELCLEYRPDNWEPSITGAMMIESAVRLIVGERPKRGFETDVPSAHEPLMGRDLRSKNYRFLATSDLVHFLSGLPLNVPFPSTFWRMLCGELNISSITQIGGEEKVWDTANPVPPTAVRIPGFVLNTDRVPPPWDYLSGNFFDQLKSVFPELGGYLPTDQTYPFLVLNTPQSWEVLRLFHTDGESFGLPFENIVERSGDIRISPSLSAIAGKKVAIVGCGSVGSKIATTLARTGVRDFVLVDDDVLLFGNLERNDLDANGVGRHKVDALASRLAQIVSEPNVSCRRIALGSQEASSSVESVMTAIGECDLIVDATADPRAFNLSAAVARRNERPMVWCEVLSGGIGGFVARARPHVDPEPSQARLRLQAWCEMQGTPWEIANEREYAVETPGQAPLVADDSAVTIIAAHAARFAIDILSGEESQFSVSAYAIGLSARWIFNAPFDTFPIDLGAEDAWRASEEEPTEEELLAVIKEFMPTKQEA